MMLMRPLQALRLDSASCMKVSRDGTASDEWEIPRCGSRALFVDQALAAIAFSPCNHPSCIAFGY